MNWKPNRSSHLSLHIQITDWIKERIQNGEWTVGTKLPAQRRLAENFEVNRSTVVAALDELTADGLIETRPGGGTYISNDSWNILLKNAQPDWDKHITESIHEPNYHTIQLINEYEQDQDIIRLGTGELSPSLLPADAIEQALQSITLQPRDMGYSEPKGNKKLRSVLSQHLKNRNIHASPDNILIVSGALQALQLISLGLLEQGSVVFQESPSYLNSVHPFQSAGMQVISFQKNEEMQTKLKNYSSRKQSIFYTVPTLHNPTGSTMTLGERRHLLETCHSLHIPIIEDDVYHDLLFSHDTLPALKALDESGQVLYIGSLSKTLSPGLRIGWIVGPQPVINRLADIKMQTDYGSSAISQQIAAHWLQSQLYEKHLHVLRSELEKRAQFMHTLLLKYFSDAASWHKPTGGFYIWLRFNKPIVNKSLFLRLIKQQILINPGYIYNPHDQHHIRLSYAYADLAEMEKGLVILKQALR
ncbi:aminotransferase-like domain-containing protein [Cytobacillus purgationiresistens]|uniref:GntR family transcriptional regulator of abcA and norABC n=1 Tax=Cytobacillus purgationiresistens TaxID=863449 RepID=A0ABU0AIQ6_9BACI|nr:PLP-dependent aminotransferase family protein [Cytobacillus purgationiresistens]MDQ0270591.1 GntR family transcriptional regulator of abcA and norABC [Cytobacillus purgationiresistens]